MLRGLWVLGRCASVALVALSPLVALVALMPHGEARAAGPAPGPAEVASAEPPGPVVEVVGPRAPAVEVTTAKRVRHDWYLGGGLGLGGGNLGGATGGGAVAATAWLRVGGRLREKVGLGGALVSSFGGRSGSGGSGFTNLLAEALFFPVKGRGLGLAVGLGVSSAWVRVPDTDGMLVQKQSRVGLGLSAGLGYDFWLARRFNLGLWLRGDASAGGYGLRASGTVGLGFSWY